MEKKRHGSGSGSGSGAAFFTALCLLDVVSLLLPRSAGAAQDGKHWHAHPVVGSNGAVAQWAPAPHVHAAGLPPLSAPPPTAGADDLPPSVSSPPSRAPGRGQQAAPHFGFPLQPTLGSASAAPPAAVGQGGEGYPFIGSNPTVPLPTGMTDTATVLPLPDTGDATTANNKVVGLAACVRARVSIIGLGAFVAILLLFTTS